MHIPVELTQKYNLTFLYLVSLKKIVDKMLFQYCNRSGFAYSSRIKKLESLNEKIETGRFLAWSEIDDLLGVAIIIPNIKLEAEVVDNIRSFFVIEEVRKKGKTLLEPEKFRFDSTRVICHYEVPGQVSPLSEIKIEVQIRSAFTHAWQVSMHEYVYKAQSIDWRRKRLSAQIKANVEQLDQLIANFEEVKNFVEPLHWPEIGDMKKIGTFLDVSFKSNMIPDYLKPKDISRFIENLYNVVKTSPEANPKRKIKTVITALEIGIKRYEDSDFPLSLSLFSVFVAILIEAKIIEQNRLNEIVLIDKESTVILFNNDGINNVKKFDFQSKN